MSGRDPTEAVRAVVFVLPLAVLAGSIVAPPDPFSQLAVIALTMLVGVPLSRRVLTLSTYRPLTIGAFYLVVTVVVLVGLVGLSALPLGSGSQSVLGDAIVVGIGLLAGYRVTLAGGR